MRTRSLLGLPLRLARWLVKGWREFDTMLVVVNVAFWLVAVLLTVVPPDAR